MCDREGVTYHFFYDSPEKRADRYPLNATSFLEPALEKPHKQGLPDHKRCVNAGGNTFSHGFRGYKGEHFVLHDADEAADEGDTVELGTRKLERGIGRVVGDDEYVVVVGALAYALDERALSRVEDVGFVPLEENVAEGDALAGHEVARIISRLHGIALDGHKEVSPLESRDDIALTFVLHNLRIPCERPGHRAKRNKGYALLAAFGYMDSHFFFCVIFLRIFLIFIIFTLARYMFIGT